MPTPRRSRSISTTPRGTPAERAAELHAEQVRLKREAAERRERRAAAARAEDGRRTPRST
jgi:hypothetical protein